MDDRDPPARLRRRLAAARRGGASFDDAWKSALLAALALSPRHEQSEWRGALEETRDAWHDAYYRLPSRASAAAALLPVPP